MMNTEWKICGMGYWKGGNKKRQIDGCSNMKQYVCENEQQKLWMANEGMAVEYGI